MKSNSSLVILFTILIGLTAGSVLAREYHVSVSGSDTNKGAKATPLKTISAAAAKAQPGDTIIGRGPDSGLQTLDDFLRGKTEVLE